MNTYNHRSLTNSPASSPACSTHSIMKKAVIYARYSSDSQSEQSIEGQLRVCNDYAKSNNISILDTYIDRAMTGKNDKRPDFQRMLQDSKKKLWDYVIVYKYDRFSRNIFDSTVCEHELNKNGVKLLSAMENIPDAPEGIILKSLLQSMNHYYSDELAQKVKRGMRETRLKGFFQGGYLLYGYKLNGRKVEVNPEEAQVVNLIFNKYNAGVFVDDIIIELNNKNISYRGKKWSRNTIYKMLANSKYTGKYIFENEVVDNIYPQIISDELFNIIKQKKLKNKHGSHSVITNYLLKNRLTCGYCGKPITAECGKSKTGNIYRYYKCSGKKTFKNGCQKSILKKEVIEKFIINEIIRKLRSPKIMNPLIDTLLKVQNNSQSNRVTLNILKQELKQSKISLNNLLSAMEKGIINQTTNDRIIELEKKIKELDELIIIEESKNKQIYTREYLEKYYDDMLLDNSSMVINYLIKNIKMYDTKMEITFNSPINQSPEYQGFLFCEKIGVMTIYQPVKRIYENIEIDIEMYI